MNTKLAIYSLGIALLCAPNQSMKPTAPLRNKFGVFVATPAVIYLFLVRRNRQLHSMEKEAPR
jgi:hypothetical protein